MSAEFFEVTEHVIPAQHIREYAGGAQDDDTILQLVVREYRPRNNLDPAPDSVTLICTPGNSDPGPCYEPVWDDLVQACQRVKIRAIWVADSVDRGASYVVNEYALGDEPSKWDHSRDLLCMVNHFRARMRRPIVGIGHSSGTCLITHLATMHTRLFHSLVMVEPAYQASHPRRVPWPASISKRRDLWPSMADAETWFRNSAIISTYEPRMFDAYVRNMLRPTPTAAYPPGTAPPGSVTLKTPKAHELWAFGRPDFTQRVEGPRTRRDRLLRPGLDATAHKYPFMQGEAQEAYRELKQLAPGVLLVFGAKSALNTPEVRAQYLSAIGTGIWGSGGAEAGLVKQVVIPGGGHILPQQKPTETAGAIAGWLEIELQRFKDETEFIRKNTPDKSRQYGSVISDWMQEKMTPAMWDERPVKAGPKPAKL